MKDCRSILFPRRDWQQEGPLLLWGCAVHLAHDASLPQGNAEQLARFILWCGDAACSCHEAAVLHTAPPTAYIKSEFLKMSFINKEMEWCSVPAEIINITVRWLAQVDLITIQASADPVSSQPGLYSQQPHTEDFLQRHAGPVSRLPLTWLWIWWCFSLRSFKFSSLPERDPPPLTDAHINREDWGDFLMCARVRVRLCARVCVTHFAFALQMS